MSVWDLKSAKDPGVAAFVAHFQGAAPARSDGLPAAVLAGGAEAATAEAELEALATADEVAVEALPPEVAAGLRPIPIPSCCIQRTHISSRNPYHAGLDHVFKSLTELAGGAVAAGISLPHVHAAAVIRIAPPGSAAAQSLALRRHRFLHGTDRAPLSQPVQRARQGAMDAYCAGLVGAGWEATGQPPHAGPRSTAAGLCYEQLSSICPTLPLACGPPCRCHPHRPAAASPRPPGHPDRPHSRPAH